MFGKKPTTRPPGLTRKGIIANTELNFKKKIDHPELRIPVIGFIGRIFGKAAIGLLHLLGDSYEIVRDPETINKILQYRER